MANLPASLALSRKAASEPKTSVLLVDDIPANLLSLRVLLQDLDVKLVEAHSGEEALERVQADEFAVVLLDVQMPRLSGFETAKLIRGRTRSRHTPIIFMTANDIGRPQLEEAYALGAVDVLVKPLLPIVVQAKVRGFVDLFEEKQQAKREADQLRLLVEGAKDYAIFLLDPQGHVASWNTGAERIKQYRAEEIIGEHFSRFYPNEAIERSWPAHELKTAQAEGRFEDEGWRVRKDGSQFWANVVITALRDDAGNLRGFSKITRDMTERKNDEEAARRLLQEEAARKAAQVQEEKVRQSEQELADFFENASVGLHWVGPDGTILRVNRAELEMLGYRREEFVGHSIAEFHADEQAIREIFRRLNAGEKLKEYPAQLRCKDGSIKDVLIDSSVLRREGQFVHTRCFTRDVTARKRAEEALRESEERVRLALEAGCMGVWEWDIQTNKITWSDSLEPLHGLASGSFDGTYDGFQKLIHPEDRERVNHAIQQAVTQGTSYDIEFRNIWPNGSIHWIAGKGMVIADSNGRPERMIGIAMDMTQRKRAEQTARFLADASATLAVLVDFDSTLQKVASLAVPYFADWATVDMVEADGSLRRVAVAHVDPSKVALAHEVHRRFAPDPEAPQGTWNILRTGKAELVPELTDELLRRSIKHEELLHIMRELGLRSYMGVPLKVRGKVLGVVTFISAESGHRYDATDLAIAQDLADRGGIAIENAQLYRELREADRRKDEFLATLAHELRNPLAPIRNSLQILKMPRIDAPTAQQARDMMERQMHHLVRLVDDLLDVSRVMRGKIELRKEPIELATVVARAVETASPLIEVQGHQLDVALPVESLLLDADPVRLAQVIGNLLTNAAKYTESNGRIWLTATREDGHAVLKVRDNGIGIAADMLPHVFDLFVQVDHTATRAQGGLGIGLTLVKNLVEMHAGTVAVHSAGLGKGSEFIVRLPLAAKVHRKRSDVNELSDPARATGFRLLVVDDNEDAAVSLAMLLRLQGHEVRVANEGLSALELAKTMHPDLVFLDIGMPGMDGYEVARRLRQTPGLEKTILAALTGWGQQEDRRRSAAAGFDHHLVKPPEPKALESVLAGLKRLGAASGASFNADWGT